MTITNRSVARTAPMILFQSQDSIRSRSELPGRLWLWPSGPSERSNLIAQPKDRGDITRTLKGVIAAKRRINSRKTARFSKADESDRPDPRASRIDAPARQTAGRHCGRSDDRARLAAGDGRQS